MARSGPERQPTRRGRGRWLVSLAIAVLIPIAFGSWIVVGRDSPTERDAVASPLPTEAFEEATGVQILRVAVTAGGGILDLRYRVLDPDKAIVVHDRDNPPAIIHEASNRTANRPFMHHTKARDMHLAVTYYELLLNPDEAIKVGDPVTVVLGGAMLEHVIVQ